jgi:nitroreductase
MELREALSRRRMVRSFDGRPVDPDELGALCAEALRAPTAGNSAGVVMGVVAPGDVADFFEVATDPQWRQHATRAPGLLRGGAVVICCSLPAAYVERYREPDKSSAGLADVDDWPVPYWHTDAAMATMALLLLVEERGWQAVMWGAFRHQREILSWARAPEGAELFASVIIGHADGQDRPSSSLVRPTDARRDRVWRVGVEEA